MGSSGSGSFSDYSGSKQQSNSGGSSGGSSGDDLCRRAFNVSLEDVGLYDYFKKTSNVPPANTVLSIVVAKRPIAIDPNGVSVGALPTKYNYLLGCISSGNSYTGLVTFSLAGSTPRVDVDFTAV
ncbi:hypothetical protein D8770_21875 [Methylobacterium sp. DB1607]|nr:hypothetical protein [Methylobacterium sp. DB1607]